MYVRISASHACEAVSKRQGASAKKKHDDVFVLATRVAGQQPDEPRAVFGGALVEMKPGDETSEYVVWEGDVEPGDAASVIVGIWEADGEDGIEAAARASLAAARAVGRGAGRPPEIGAFAAGGLAGALVSLGAGTPDQLGTYVVHLRGRKDDGVDVTVEPAKDAAIDGAAIRCTGDGAVYRARASANGEALSAQVTTL